MTPTDLIIGGFTLLMAVWGFSHGLAVGALSLAGFAGGALLGSRVGPLVLEEGSKSPFAPLVTLTAGLLIGGLLAVMGEMLGFQIRRRLGGGLGALDGLGGAVLLACLGLGLAWIGGAVALQTPGARTLRPDIQRSKILRALNEALPPSGPILNAIARFDPLPEFAGPVPRVPPPNAAIARDPQVRAASRSVVRVFGTACGLGVQGSGWVAGDGVIVTNAHVVAGQDDTTVQVGGEGPRLRARVISYDTRNDLAVLRVPEASGAPALPLGEDAEPGTSAAILGFPVNGPYDVRPGRLGPTRELVGKDAYGEGPVRRPVTLLRGHVRSGNSGGPMVDGRGRVVTTVFAASPFTDEGRSGFGVPDYVTRRALATARGPVGTGPCTS